MNVSQKIHKFPRTPHLYWLSQTALRDDKIMSPLEAADFLNGEIIVEEKIDGSNLGISLDRHRHVRAQNRGQFLRRPFTGQWKPLAGWIAQNRARIEEHLPADVILFGEWCYLKHGISYTMLPDWFLGFDVFDLGTEQFWSVQRRDALCATMELPVVAQIRRGEFTQMELRAMLDRQSSYYSGPVEGLYLRKEGKDYVNRRAKLVRPEFVHSISEHWTRIPSQANRCASFLLKP
jgi:RNA ligase